MEGAAPEAAWLDAGQLVDAVEHFLGGFVGEREQQDVAGLDAFGEQVGDAVGEGARFAGACTGEHEQRPRLGRDGGVLLVVELGAEVDRRDGGRLVGVVAEKIHDRRRSLNAGRGESGLA